MLKKKDMRRSDWQRILKKEYRCGKCAYRGKRGIASILLLHEVSEPLTIHYDHGDVTIVNQGDTWLQIAFQDAYFWVTAMFDRNDQLLQIYFDITNSNCLTDEDNPMFEDLYLDIVMEPDGTLHVLDQDELDEALKNGEISADQYRKAQDECVSLYQFLREDWKAFAAFCQDEMMKLKNENRVTAGPDEGQ